MPINTQLSLYYNTMNIQNKIDVMNNKKYMRYMAPLLYIQQEHWPLNNDISITVFSITTAVVLLLAYTYFYSWRLVLMC